MSHLRFEQLEYIVAIAETESFSAAATKLFVTQQAISTSMKQLEQELGQTLFIKENNKTLLTKAGDDVLSYANKTLQERDALFANMNKQTEENTVCVTISSTFCVANMTLPKIITELQNKKRKVNIKIAQAESIKRVLEKVHDGVKDIGLISYNANEFHAKYEAYRATLQADILARDKLGGVVNRKFYNGEQNCVTLSDYDSSLKMMYNIEPVDARRIDAWNTNMVCSSDADFHRAMLEKEGSLAVMSGLSAQYFFHNKKYVAMPIQDQDFEIQHIAVYRKDAQPHIQELVRMIRKEMHIK